VLLGFDEKSLAEIGRWPWDRSVYAEFLKTVNSDPQSSPVGVLLDVLFTENSQEADDRILAEALGEYRDNTVVDMFADVSNQIPNVSTEIQKRIELMKGRGIPARDGYDQVVNVITPPIPRIIESGVHIAPATSLYGINPRLAAKEADQTARRFAVVVKINDEYYPSTVLWLAMMYYRVGIDDVEVRLGKHVVLHNAVIPGRAGSQEQGMKGDVYIPSRSQGEPEVFQ
jgi:hypothetical protein